MTLTPLRFEDGVLAVLDQRALPRREVWLRCTEVEEVAVAIETLAVRGAPAIGVAAAYGMCLAAPEGFAAALGRLARTRPTAVNLAWALERCREAGPDRVRVVADAIAEREDRATRLIAAHGAELLGGRVMTHCNAGALACTGVGTALGVIRGAFEAGRVDEVWVPETRPLLQGARLTAYELAHDAIPHRVITDSMTGHVMAQGLVDAAVVGADRIAANGDVANKIGTYTLAVLAQRHGVPLYVAAPVSTIDLTARSGDDIPIEQRDPSEVTDSFAAANWAFDVTPNDLVAAIVTERGVLRPPYGDALARCVADLAAR